MSLAARWGSLVGLAVVAACLVGSGLAAEPPAAPKVSTFAPAQDLVSQVDYYLERLEATVESESEYKDSADKVAKDASTLAVIGLALGLHDEDNKYKNAAPALIKAAQKLAATKDFASAKAGVAAVKDALGTKGDPSGLKWEKVASLKELMLQVPLVNSRLKRYLRGVRFTKMAKDTAGSSATLAAVAQASIADTSEAKNPGDVEKWYKYCVDMRDAAGALNAAIRALDQKAAEAAMKKMAKSCDDCHEVFHPEAKDKMEQEEN